MKIRLLNDGCYWGLEDVEFPVEVQAEDRHTGYCDVTTDELCRVGGDPTVLDDPDNQTWPFGPESWEAVE